MKARVVSNDLQAIERDIHELEDGKTPAILLLKEKLIRTLNEFDLKTKRLQQELKLCAVKIADAKKRQSDCEDFPLLDDKQEGFIKVLDDMDVSKSVILFDADLASACQLSPEEKNAWFVRSNALYGSYLNPVSYMRSFAAWRGASYIRQTPFIGESIAGPSSVCPEAVMLKLKNILDNSTKKKMANQDYLNAVEEKKRLEKELQETRSYRLATEREIQRIQTLNARIHDYDRVMNLTTNVSHDPFLYLKALLEAKTEIDKIRYAQHQGFELFIKERVDKLQAEINAVTTTIINQYDHIADSEVRYHYLLQSRKEMYRLLGDEIPDELYFKIQKLHVQKAWDTTYEVHKFGDQKREFKHYFLGIPQYLGLKKSFVFSWILYTMGCGFLFTPIKNTLKLFTEAFPKIMDAHCENNLEKLQHSNFAVVGHYIFKAWWLTLRPLTSPIVSLKAAWKSYDNYDNKYMAWTSRLLLSGLSLTLSLAAVLTVIVVIPKVALGLLGEAGGVVTAAATTADAAIIPAVPVTYANVAATVRGVLGLGLDKSSSAEMTKRMALHTNHKLHPMRIENISSTISNGVVKDTSSHHDPLPESKPTDEPLSPKPKR